MFFKNNKRFFGRDIKSYMPRLIRKSKTIDQIVKKIKARYSKKEIVDYFKSFEGNNFIFLTEEDDLFLHGERLNSFDNWLSTVINLLVFSSAQEAYENHIDEITGREQQLSFALELKKAKKLSREQYLYLIEIINCRSDITIGKI